MPTLRGVGADGFGAATSITIPFPAGAEVGDRCIVMVRHQYGTNGQDEWPDLIAFNEGGSVYTTVRSRILDADDITAGEVTFTSGGNGNSGYLVALFDGDATLRYPFAWSTQGSVGDNGDVVLSSEGNVEAGDLCLLWVMSNTWNDDTITEPDGFDELIFHPDPDGVSGSLYQFEPEDDGAFTMNHHMTWGARAYQVIFAFTDTIDLDGGTEVENTDAFETYTVPSGATSIAAKLWGGGGHGGNYSGGRVGGGGAFVEVAFPVSPGDVIAVQAAGGGWNHTGSPSRKGGYPDGGAGSYGDTGGAGGGGSSRIWKNGELMAVAAGGGSAAGYSGSGSPGGDFIAAWNSGNGTSGGTATAVGGPLGVRRGRPLVVAGPTGRTGGFGGAQGYSTGEDGGGGGGGWMGGGGGGGDGGSGAGGSSWANPDCTFSQSEGGGQIGGVQWPGGFGDPDYPGGYIGFGNASNQDDPGNPGFVKMKCNTGTLSAGGTPPNDPWTYAFDWPGAEGEIDFQNDTIRCRIDTGAYSAFGSTIRILMHGYDAGLRIGKFYVALRDPDTDTAEYGTVSAGPFIPVTWNDGDAGAILAPGEWLWSDPVEIELDSEASLVYSMWVDDGGTSKIRRSSGLGYVGWKYHSNVDYANTTGTPGGSGDGWYHQWLDAVQVLSGSLDPGGAAVRRRAIVVT